MKKEILILFVFIILGLFFIGKGITGMVISQSCCFPPNCDAENLCDAARPDIENPYTFNQNIITTIIGLVLLLSSILH